MCLELSFSEFMECEVIQDFKKRLKLKLLNLYNSLPAHSFGPLGG